MATELVKRSIDGKEYEFEQFGAKQALKVLVRLSKIIGKPMALASGVAKKDKDGEKFFDEQILAQAADALTSALDENEALNLVETLCAEKVLCDGVKVDFNKHYEGKMSHLFRVLTAALEVQFGDFFDALQGSLK